MSIVDDIIPEGAEPAADETGEAPTEAPLASQEHDEPQAETEAAEQPADDEAAAAAAAGDPWAAVREAGYGNLVDQYQGDLVKLAKALADAKAYITSKQQPDQPQTQQQQEAEAEAELMPGSVIWPPDTVEELYQAAQNPEFAGHAAIWAMENRHRIPQNVLQDVVNNWWFTNPAQAQAYQTQQLIRAEMERFQQQIQPVQEHTAHTISNAAKSLAQQWIDGRVPGDWDRYQGKIAEVLADERAQQFFFDDQATPEGLAEGLKKAYGWIKQQEWLAQGGGQQQPAQPASQNDAPSQQEPSKGGDERPRDERGRFAATTSGRGSAPNRNPTTAEEIRDAILGV